MSDSNHIEDIMLRYLNGESSEDESRVLEEWIAKSKSNAEEFELVKSIWTDTTNAALIPVDTEKAWMSVHEKTIGMQPKVIKMNSWKKIIAIAASIIIIAGIFYFTNRAPETAWNDIIAQNSNKKVQLNDGTVIILREGSKISLPGNYGRDSRKVKLDGEAFFEVTHNAKNAFTVFTSKSIIKDIGTSFLVQSIDSIEQVTVTEGVVQFEASTENNSPIVLRAGEAAYMKNEIIKRINADTANILSWNSKILVFNNTPLAIAANDLEHYYNIRVEVEGNIGSTLITAEFRNEPLEQVLKELRLITDLDFNFEQGKLLISKK